MKITINSSDLSRALSAVSRCIASKSVLPILECFHLEAVGEQLRITAADNENWFTIVVRPTDITYLDDGFSHAFCIESKRFLAVIRELSSQPIGLELSADHKSATLRWQNGEAQLPILPADEYPIPASIPPIGTIESIKLPTTALRHIIDTCSFAVANDELRPVMNGIYFDRMEGSLACCATNGHSLVRLKHKELPAPADPFILHSRSANLLGTFLAEMERCTPKGETATVAITVGGNNVVFSCESLTASGRLVCRMIEGRYPNYNSVIQANPPYEMTLSRAELIAALRRTMVFANSATLLVRLQVAADRLTLSAADIDFSTSSEETVPCTFNGSDGFFIGFKGTLLLEILNHLDTDEVKVLLTDHSRAGIFVPQENEGDCEPLMLLMPMMLDR